MPATFDRHKALELMDPNSYTAGPGEAALIESLASAVAYITELESQLHRLDRALAAGGADGAWIAQLQAIAREHIPPPAPEPCRHVELVQGTWHSAVVYTDTNATHGICTLCGEATV